MKKRRDILIILYWIAVITLTILVGGVTIKVLFAPLCVPNAQGVCPVDGGSIVGFATAILGLAAAILAILGAFAVAYWWANLDKKVNTQVEEKVNTQINQRLQDQEQKFLAHITKLTSQITPLETNVQNAAAQISQLDTQISEREKQLKELDQRIQEQEKNFNAQIAGTENKLKDQVEQLDKRMREVNENAIISATLVDPWRSEGWVDTILATEPTSQAGFRMVRSYLKIVDELIPGSTVGYYTPQMMKRRDYYEASGPSGNPIYYWNKALEWQGRVDQQPGKPYSQTTAKHIDQMRPRIEEYQKKQDNPQSPNASL